MRTRLVVLAIVLLTAFAVMGAADTPNPLIGTWKLNVAKSTYTPGPAPNSLRYKYAPYGKDGLKYTSDGVDAQGKSTHTEYAAELDGKDYPTKGFSNADSVSLKRIDANTSEGIQKKNGHITLTYRRVVSEDGKTLTLTGKGTDAQGHPTTNVSVFDRQ